MNGARIILDPVLPTELDGRAIALPLYPREDWYIAANSLEEFLGKFKESRGEKFWESQTQPTE